MSFLKLTTPTNILEEKEYFFKNNNCSPRFKYLWEKDIKLDNSELLDLLKLQNYDKLTKFGMQNFQIAFNENELKLAKKRISNIPAKKLIGNVDMLKTRFKAVFSMLGLDYGVEIVDKVGFNCRPNYKNKILLISKFGQFDYFSIEGEVRHELIHIIRAENGKYNQIEKSINYLPTEEGIATYYHDFGGSEVNYSSFQHAAEYLASQIAIKNGFKDVFYFFKDLGFNQELAWQRAIRHKFGLIDTSEKGSLCKPAMYFEWGEKIAALNRIERESLLTGKVNYDGLNNLKQYYGRWKIETLRELLG